MVGGEMVFDGMERGPVRRPVVVLLECVRGFENETPGPRGISEQEGRMESLEGHRDGGLPAWRST
jgi:hypothetical protein